MKPETAISLASAFIALLALGVAIWQGIIARKHNRLSVKPILAIDTFLSLDHETIGIKLRNNGVGPLILKNISFQRGSVRASLNDGSFKNMLPALANRDFNFTGTSPGFSLVPNESFWLISTSRHSDQNGLMDILFDSLTGITIKFEYESVYQERFSGTWALS
ncbi:MAG: hypothetical protein C0620_03920 [Desulfuromonas sp.]|nr:MAG: hypothetical protein C0620_03920 [Desulfuromonas sp.]